jgi:hypothetical protein
VQERSLSIYVQLKSRIMVAQVSAEMNAHIEHEFGVGSLDTHCREWRSTSLAEINRTTAACSKSRMVAFRFDSCTGKSVQQM